MRRKKIVEYRYRQRVWVSWLVKGSTGEEGNGGDAGGQSEGFAEERLADQTKTFVFLGSTDP